MAKTFRCRIVTPTEPVLDQPCTYVTLPAWDGQKGVIPSQSPFLVRLGQGAMRVDFPGGGDRQYLVESGFAQMRNDVLTVLTDQATPAERLSVSEAEAELASLTGKHVQGAEREEIDRRQDLARAKLALARSVATKGI